MDKRKVVDEIQTYLAGELASLLPAAEAGTLDADGGERIREIRRQLTMYKFLPVREFGTEDVVCPASLVELELGERRAFYLIVPSGGGLVMRIEESPVQVITPQSPLGEALLGRRVGETVRVQGHGGERNYRIVSLR
jgi:transcription elongation GreA/GreB family factor